MSKPVLKNFVVTIKNGSPQFSSEYQEVMYKRFLSQFEGERVWLEVNGKLPKRSDRQNRFYWFYLNIIARDTGEDPEYLHERFKDEFLYVGEQVVFGVKTKLFKSTANLNKTEFSEYMEKICRLTEIPMPDPSIFDLAPLKQ